MPIVNLTESEVDLLKYELASYLESTYQGHEDLTAKDNANDLFTINSAFFDEPKEAELRQLLACKLVNCPKGE